MCYLKNAFLNQDKYISEKEYKEFAIKKNLPIDINKLKARNEKFVDDKLIEYKSYFDNIFATSNTKINLDDEQRRII